MVVLLWFPFRQHKIDSDSIYAFFSLSSAAWVVAWECSHGEGTLTTPRRTTPAPRHATPAPDPLYVTPPTHLYPHARVMQTRLVARGESRRLPLITRL